MGERHLDPVARTLILAVSATYFGAWIVFGSAVVAMPLARLLLGSALSFPQVSAMVPVRAPGLGQHLLASGMAGVEFGSVRGYIRFPVEIAPAWLVAVWWGEVVVFGGLLLGVLRNVRKVFQRVRDGAPFDEANSLRLRWVGILLLCFGVGSTVDQYWMSAAVLRLLATDSALLRPALDIHWAIVIAGLAVIALAEVFRRGAALEEEQSLVV